MAVKQLLIHFGQSNDSPHGDYASWSGANPGLDVANPTFYPSTLSIGSYGDKFTVPGNIPGFTNPIDIRARALSAIRYLTEFNPLCTGYKTYPCVGRTRTGATTLINFVVEQTFEAASVTGAVTLTRFLDQTQHKIIACTPNAAGATLKIVPTNAKTITAVNTGTEVVTLNAAHGWATDTPVRLVFNSGGALPGGLTENTTVFVRSPSGADLQFAATPGGAAINLSAGFAATVFVFAVADSWQNVVVGEQFTYTIAGVTGTSPVVLPLGFGNIRAGTLVGLKLRGVTGANANQSRVITGYNNLNREAVLSSALPNAIGGTDAFVIEPQVGTFDRYALFLPWCPLEAGHTANKTNPWPPGFNWPNHYHVPRVYNPFADVGQGLMTGANAVQTAYHITLGARLQELLGEEILIVGCDFGGVSLARSELRITEACDIGWFDQAQLSCWIPGEVNSCFQRLCDTIDAGIAAAALEGHTLQVALVTFMQGETDALDADASNNYYSNVKVLFSALRTFLKNRGLWAKSPESIPIIHPQILDPEFGGAWPLSKTVNAAKRRVSSEDRFTRSPVTNGIAQFSSHYTGIGHTVLAQTILEAFREMRATTDQSGEVAICNAALALIGDTARITSIDPPDGSAQAALCALHYARARDIVLEAGQWSFAMRRIPGESFTSPTSNWAFAYRLPSDSLKIVSVLPLGLGEDYPVTTDVLLTQRETMTQFLSTGQSSTQSSVPAYQFQLEDNDNSTVILSNVDTAEIRYVAKVTDTRKFSNQFTEALTWKLASLVVGATVKGDAGRAEAKRCLEMCAALTIKAGAVDGKQQKVSPPRIAPWHKHR